MKLDGCFSHKTDHWSTPKHIYDYFINVLNCVDPCPLYSEVDNLKMVYPNKKIFINPPYSKISLWVDFIRNNLMLCDCIYLLIPARTDTKYFHDLLELHPDIYFIKGRLKFGGSKCGAPFPSLLLYFDLFQLLFDKGSYSIWKM